MKKVILIVGFLSIAKIGYGQPCIIPIPQTVPPTYTCPAGVIRTLFWDYTQPVVPGDVFRVFVNNVQIGPDIPARQATGISVQLTSATAPGTYMISAATARPSANFESIRVPLTLILTSVNPIPPANLRVVEVIIRGLDEAGLILWERTERVAAQ